MMRALVAMFTLATVLLPAAHAVDSAIDRNALTDLYRVMGGDGWANSAYWLTPDISMCSWYGVVCGSCPTNDASIQCRVTELNLGVNGLQGPIAPAVQQLTNLTKLVLGGNALGGTIPSFSALTSLQWLDLNTTQLTGSIPEFQSLVNLRRIVLYGNELQGTLPTFANSVRLEHLDVGLCYGLNGAIPSFSNLVELQKLYLGQNRFSGSVPALTTLTQLQFLFLNGNELNGTVPEFTTLKQLQQLSVSHNQLTGTVPAFAALSQLQRLYLNNNDLTGTIPSFANLTQLQRIHMNNNRLAGTVPGFESLVRLQTLYLYDNELTGTVPAFVSLASLQRLHLSRNHLSGTVPALASLTQLQLLYLSQNLLTGTIPRFSNLPRLETLFMHDNSLSGVLPAFENSPALKYVDLGANLLSGTLPSLVSLPLLKVLRVSKNRLTGSLPSSWRMLRSLTLIDVADNMLDGQILLYEPNELPPLSVGFMNLSFNRFGSTFIDLPPPDTINLTSIDIRGNQLLCPYPEFALSLRVLRSVCQNDWVQLGIYAGIAAGVAVFAITLHLVIKRHVSEQRVRMTLFSIFWVVSAVSVLSDAYSYQATLTYLQKRSANCDSVNEVRVFDPQVFTGRDLPRALHGIPGNYLFSEWINPKHWIDTSGSGSGLDLNLLQQFTDSFASACRQAPECAYDDTLKQCYKAHPELATSGGGAHQAFYNTVITLVAIRVAYELFCMIVIFVSCVRNSIILNCRVWIKSSVFLPLLLVRDSMRGELLEDIVLADTPPSEYILELLTSGIVVTGMKLFSQTYYLLWVAQTGLVASNWLSLMLGLVTVARLVGQAAWSRRKQHQNDLLEEHYVERAASGAEFMLDDMVGGVGTDTYDYVRM
jgi:Leucine-rich repeat (LRR) protein